MASSVRFKFKSSLQFDSIQFDGSSISVRDLKNSIRTKYGLRSNDYDLKLEDDKGKEYSKEDELIPKYTSIIIRRVPKVNTEPQRKKIANPEDMSRRDVYKNQAGSSGLKFHQLSKVTNLANSNLSEDEKIKLMMEQASDAYTEKNYLVKAKPYGVPPLSYVCRKCNQGGHWIHNCTGIKDQNGRSVDIKTLKRPTGIPRDLLLEVDYGTPGAYLSQTGRYVVPIKDAEAYAMGKKEKRPFSKEENPAYVPTEEKVPEQLKCPLCREIFTDPVLVSCCCTTFCNNCIMDYVFDSEEGKNTCPKCSAKITDNESSFKENSAIRIIVQEWKDSNRKSLKLASGSANNSPRDGVKDEPQKEEKVFVAGRRVLVPKSGSSSSLVETKVGSPAVSKEELPELVTKAPVEVKETIVDSVTTDEVKETKTDSVTKSSDEIKDAKIDSVSKTPAEIKKAKAEPVVEEAPSNLPNLETEVPVDTNGSEKLTSNHGVNETETENTDADLSPKLRLDKDSDAEKSAVEEENHSATDEESSLSSNFDEIITTKKAPSRHDSDSEEETKSPRRDKYKKSPSPVQKVRTSKPEIIKTAKISTLNSRHPSKSFAYSTAGTIPHSSITTKIAADTTYAAYQNYYQQNMVPTSSDHFTGLGAPLPNPYTASTSMYVAPMSYPSTHPIAMPPAVPMQTWPVANAVPTPQFPTSVVDGSAGIPLTSSDATGFPSDSQQPDALLSEEQFYLMKARLLTKDSKKKVRRHSRSPRRSTSPRMRRMKPKSRLKRPPSHSGSVSPYTQRHVVSPKNPPLKRRHRSRSYSRSHSPVIPSKHRSVSRSPVGYRRPFSRSRSGSPQWSRPVSPRRDRSRTPPLPVKTRRIRSPSFENLGKPNKRIRSISPRPIPKKSRKLKPNKDYRSPSPLVEYRKDRIIPHQRHFDKHSHDENYDMDPMDLYRYFQNVQQGGVGYQTHPAQCSYTYDQYTNAQGYRAPYSHNYASMSSMGGPSHAKHRRTDMLLNDERRSGSGSRTSHPPRSYGSSKMLTKSNSLTRLKPRDFDLISPRKPRQPYPEDRSPSPVKISSQVQRSSTDKLRKEKKPKVKASKTSSAVVVRKPGKVRGSSKSTDSRYSEQEDVYSNHSSRSSVRRCAKRTTKLSPPVEESLSGSDVAQYANSEPGSRSPTPQRPTVSKKQKHVLPKSFKEKPKSRQTNSPSPSPLPLKIKSKKHSKSSIHKLQTGTKVNSDSVPSGSLLKHKSKRVKSQSDQSKMKRGALKNVSHSPSPQIKSHHKSKLIPKDDISRSPSPIQKQKSSKQPAKTSALVKSSRDSSSRSVSPFPMQKSTKQLDTHDKPFPSSDYHKHRTMKYTQKSGLLDEDEFHSPSPVPKQKSSKQQQKVPIGIKDNRSVSRSPSPKVKYDEHRLSTRNKLSHSPVQKASSKKVPTISGYDELSHSPSPVAKSRPKQQVSTKINRKETHSPSPVAKPKSKQTSKVLLDDRNSHSPSPAAKPKSKQTSKVLLEDRNSHSPSPAAKPKSKQTSKVLLEDRNSHSPSPVAKPKSKQTSKVPLEDRTSHSPSPISKSAKRTSETIRRQNEMSDDASLSPPPAKPLTDRSKKESQKAGSKRRLSSKIEKSSKRRRSSYEESKDEGVRSDVANFDELSLSADYDNEFEFDLSDSEFPDPPISSQVFRVQPTKSLSTLKVQENSEEEGDSRKHKKKHKKHKKHKKTKKRRQSKTDTADLEDDEEDSNME